MSLLEFGKVVNKSRDLTQKHYPTKSNDVLLKTMFAALASTEIDDQDSPI